MPPEPSSTGGSRKSRQEVQPPTAASALLTVLFAVSCGLCVFVQLSPNAVAQTTQAEPGILETHQLPSPFQAGETSLRVLLPDRLSGDRQYPVLYVLPVHADGVFRHGDGLQEVRRLNAHNRHQLICVSPSFTAEPWYADHDQDTAKQDESHLLKTILPFVESKYPVRHDRPGRLLIGFSKSGWGAMTLLLRHPQTFGRAAVWDSGVRIDTGPFDAEFDQQRRIRTNFGSDENFQEYRVSTLVKERGRQPGGEVRLFYFNRAGGPRTVGGERLHDLMQRSGVPHRYEIDVHRDHRDHRWDSGWLPRAIKFLVADQDR